MCHSIETIAKVKSGELSRCKPCNLYHLEFNNIYLEFNPKAFQHFKDYILFIEVDYWEHKYSCAKVKRKIPIPSTQENLVLMFNKNEIKELQFLFFSQGDISEINLNISDIDYTLILN